VRSRQVNRYISWYCYDVGNRLANGDKLSEQKITNAREIWEMAHRLGFDENQAFYCRQALMCSYSVAPSDRCLSRRPGFAAACS
jgi:hypothetical protein